MLFSTVQYLENIAKIYPEKVAIFDGDNELNFYDLKQKSKNCPSIN